MLLRLVWVKPPHDWDHLDKTPVIYLKYVGEKNFIWYPVIFNPDDKSVILKLDRLESWVEDERASRVTNAMQILIPLWSISVVATVALSLLRR